MTHMKGYKDPRTVCHIDQLYAWKHGHFFPPVTVEISPVNLCNQKCLYCYSHGKSSGIARDKGLPKGLFTSIIRQCGDLGVGGILIQGTGEPLLHREIPDAFREAGACNLPVYLTTNGVLLDASLARDILPYTRVVRFSNVEPDKERYAYMHNCPAAHFDNVMANIENVVSLRKQSDLQVALIASLYLEEGTLDRMVPYLKTLKAIGIDYVMVSEAIWTSGAFDATRNTGLHSLQEKKQHIEELLKEAESLRDETFSFNCKLGVLDAALTGHSSQSWKPYSCDGIKFYTTICSDGEVYPCWRFWGVKQYSYGNLQKQSLASILQGQKAQEVYTHVSTVPPHSDECLVCGFVPLNSILNQLKAENDWKNFLI